MAPLWRHFRHEGVLSTAVVCRSRHNFFTYSWLQYIKFFHNGKTLCRPVLYWFKQNWAYPMEIFPNDANLKRQFVKFVQVKIADFVEPFEHSVVCGSHFSSWCCTDDSSLTRSKLFGSIKTTHTVGRRRGFGSGRPNWEKLSSSKVRG